MDSAEVKKNPESIQTKKIKKRRSSFIPKFACFRSDYDVPTVERLDGHGSLDMESVKAGENRFPTHLVIMVNGLIGSSQDWRYAAKQLIKRYPQDIIVHCSERNYSRLTFHGVDVTGNRLTDEVIAVIERYPHLQKISFIGHSLGGLISRYAIAKLYGRVITQKTSQENGECRSEESKDLLPQEKFKGKIAGLEPMNFITFATPHLGSRGHKQAPAFCGIYTLENVVSRASWFLGRTGNHLFLRDGGKEKLPLLVRMANDSDDLPFISALQSFRRRVAYANARFDHLVGWSTASLRRRSELPKRKSLSRSEKYPHIINVEAAKAAATGEEMSLEVQVNRCKTITMEEAMIRGLTKVSWERVDVDFGGTKQRFFAHNTIQASSFVLLNLTIDVESFVFTISRIRTVLEANLLKWSLLFEVNLFSGFSRRSWNTLCSRCFSYQSCTIGLRYVFILFNNNNSRTHLVPNHWGYGQGLIGNRPYLWQYMHEVIALRVPLK